MSVKQTIISFIKDKSHQSELNLADDLLSTIKPFDFMVLMLQLEENFKISLPFEQALAHGMTNISDFITWVELHHAQ